MTELIAKINTGYEGLIDFASITTTQNNVSAPISSVLNKKPPYSPENPFIIGSSTIGETVVLSNEKANFYISKELTRYDSTFDIQHTLKIKGYNISQVVIVFDNELNIYPKNVTIRYSTYEETRTLTSPILIIKLNQPSNELNLYIEKLNKSYSPLIIKGIYTMNELVIDRTIATEFEATFHDRQDEALPSFGIVSGSANISGTDAFNEIINAIGQKIIKKGLLTSLYIKDSTNGKEELLSSFIIDNISYNNNNKQFSIDLVDSLMGMQECETNYFTMTSTGTTAYSILLYLEIKSKSFFPNILFNVDDKSIEFFKNTTLEYPTIEGGTLWGQWRKFCEAFGVHMYQYKGKINIRCEYVNQDI